MRAWPIASVLFAGCYAAHGPPGPLEYSLVEKAELGGEWTYTALDDSGALRAGPVAVRFVIDEGYLLSYGEEAPPDELLPPPWTAVPIEEHVARDGDGCVSAFGDCVILEDPGPLWYERSLARIGWAITHLVTPERFAMPEGTEPIELDEDERVDPMLEAERDASGRVLSFSFPARYDCGPSCDLEHHFAR